MMKPYTDLLRETTKDIVLVLRDIVNARVSDIALFNEMARAIKAITPQKGVVTLTASMTETTVSVTYCSADSVVLLTPSTANAAAEASGLYVVPGAGEFVITHSNAASTDRTFNYVVFA